MTDPDRYRWHRQPLAHPQQFLDVEYVRDAPWDQHWALVFQGVTCRHEVRRLATFTDAQAAIRRFLPRLANARKEPA